MRFSAAAAALAACCTTSVHAFTNTSPFVLFSTSKFAHDPVVVDQLQPSSQVLSSAKDILSACPSGRYLVVRQPNLNAGHLRSAESAPKLRRALGSDAVAGRFSVAEVAGALDPKDLADYVRDTCEGASVDELDLDVVGPSRASLTVRQNDEYLGHVLAQYAAEGDYTVIYAAGPRPQASAGEEAAKHYEPAFEDPVHMELKRQVQHVGRAGNNTRSPGLFETYQFLTPGIFMGLVAIVVLVSILSVGISALGSLEVSYGAFEKDMGPSSQKKQQ